MPLRTRTRQSVRIQGLTILRRNNCSIREQLSQSYVDRWQKTIDVVGKKKGPMGLMPPSFFESTSTFMRPILLNREAGCKSAIWSLYGRPCTTGPTVPAATGYLSPESSARFSQNQSLAQEMIANNHPFAPVYSIPVAIKELVEVASLFDLGFKSLMGFAGNTYLNYRFGWKQFHQDLKTLASITKDLERRIRMFKALTKDGHFHVKQFLRKESGTIPEYIGVHHSAYGITATGPYSSSWNTKIWGSFTWRVTGELDIPVDELGMFNKALSVILDLESIDKHTAWNLVPFSWLVDYFLSVGSYLQSQQARYVLQPVDVCIMRHYVHEARATVTGGSAGITSTSGYFRREIKTRDVVFPADAPLLSFDLLRADRWKVILALIAKFRDRGIKV